MKMFRGMSDFILSVVLLIMFAGFGESLYAGDAPWPYALWFDGDGDYVDLPVRPREIDDGPVTFSCRLLIAPGAGEDRMKIFSGYGGRHGENRWDFEYHQRQPRRLTFNEWAGTRNNPGNRELEEGVWYFVSFVWEPGERVTLYIDGEQDASFGIRNTTLDDGYPFRIGGRPDGSEKEWEGGIRDVSLWSTARTQEQIRWEMRNPPSGDERNLVGYWPLGEEEGDIAHDRSKNNNHGKIVGAALAMGETASKLLEKSPEKVVPAFMAAVREHPSSILRLQAAKGLGMAETAGAEIKSVLLEVLKESRETVRVRLAALESLKRLDVDPDLLGLALMDIMKDVREAAPVRLEATDTVVHLDKAKGDVIPVLLDILRRADEDKALRMKALDTLLALNAPTKETVPVLLDIVRNNEETASLQLAALDALSEFAVDVEDAAPVLLATLRDAGLPETVRMKTLYTLLELNAPTEEIGAALLDALKQAEKEEAVRPAVLLTLNFYRDRLGASDIAPRELVAPLLKVLKRSPDADEAHETVLELLGEFDNKMTNIALAPALLACLENADNADGIRRAVLNGTGALEITAENIDEGADNPYPETLEEIAAYKDYVIKKYHEEICLYPDEVTEISTLEELAEYAGKSGVRVKMEPGVYWITPTNYEKFLKEIEDGFRGTLLYFSGAHSYFDLSGVEIRINSMTASLSRNPMTEVTVDGDNLIIEGLTITNTGNHASDNHVLTFRSGGDNNLLKGLKVTSRGSYPYGYVDGLRITQTWGFSGGSKKGGFSAGGSNTVFADVEVYQRASGHASGWPGHGNQTFIDCHVEGEIRWADDILAELAEPGYGPRFEDPEFLQTLKDRLTPGKLIRLCEDAFRSYPPGGEGTAKVLGGSVKNVREVFKGPGYDEVFISNVKLSGIVKGAFVPWSSPPYGRLRVVNTEMDLLADQLMTIFDESASDWWIELTVMPPDPEILPPRKEGARWETARRRYISPGRGRSASIRGRNHRITLRAGEGLDIGSIREEAPVMVFGRDIEVRNETGIPILLAESSWNCRVVTNGKVTDNGRDNTVKSISELK